MKFDAYPGDRVMWKDANQESRLERLVDMRDLKEALRG